MNILTQTTASAGLRRWSISAFPSARPDALSAMLVFQSAPQNGQATGSGRIFLRRFLLPRVSFGIGCHVLVQAKFTRAPALTTGAPHQGKSPVGLPSTDLDRAWAPRVCPSVSLRPWQGSRTHPVPQDFTSGLFPHPTRSGTQVSTPGAQALALLTSLLSL